MLNRRGFTSIELIIVIVILAILAASVAVKNPFAIQDYAPIAADQLMADIRNLQLRAMGLQASQSITFFVDSTNYGIYDVAGVRKHLPGNVAVVSVSANPLVYNSRGEPSWSGTIQLSGGTTVTVTADTGRVE